MTGTSAPRGNHLYNTAGVSKEAFLSVEFGPHTTERIIAIEWMKGAERVAQLDIWNGSKSSTMECAEKNQSKARNCRTYDALPVNITPMV